MAAFCKLSPSLLLALAASLSACGSPAVSPDGDGGTQRATATIAFSGAFTPGAAPDLTLTMATMRLEHIRLLGDAPPTGGPPSSMPMPDLNVLAFDALGAGGSVAQHPPPGLYSRVQFTVEDIELAGTWKATPFSAHLASFQGPRVDLRAATAQEVIFGADAGDVTFNVVVDPATWFVAPCPLDDATLTADTITCDDQNNMAAAMALTMRIASSFSLK